MRASDVFSFGAMLYEMATGQRAFRGESAISTLAAVLRADPQPMTAQVPRELEKIIDPLPAEGSVEAIPEHGRCARRAGGRRGRTATAAGAERPRGAAVV